MNLNEALTILTGLTEDEASVKVDEMGEHPIMLEAYNKIELEGGFKPEPQKIIIPVQTQQLKEPIDIDTAIDDIQNLDEPKEPYTKDEPEEEPIKPNAIIQKLNEIINTHPEIIQTLIEEVNTGNHKMTLQQFIDEHRSYVSDLIKDGTSKKERAGIVYNLKKDHPQISISPMLHLFEVGESTFRTERLIHKMEWDIEYKKQQIRNVRWLIHDTLKDNSEDIEGMFPGIDIKRVFDIVNKAKGV